MRFMGQFMSGDTVVKRKILHVDMDSFYSAVEARDDPSLAGKPLIIGAMPEERGVVATCSYEARKFGVRSGMNIKDAYRLCPQGIYRHPNREKYRQVSERLHGIWSAYADVVEYVALDEGYLDITRTSGRFGGPRAVGWQIKRRTKEETGLTCSVGIGYSMASAKLASEERKPDGFFEIPTPEAFVNLVIDRDVKVLYGVGEKTAEKLNQAGIFTVRDVRTNRQKVVALLGKWGQQIADLAVGIDDRPVTHSDEAEAKSIGREITFQKDTGDFEFLRDVLVVLAVPLQARLRRLKLYCRTVTLKLTYWNMKGITRSRSGECTDRASEIYLTASALLDGVMKSPVRLIGVSLQNLSEDHSRQLTFSDLGGARDRRLAEYWKNRVLVLQQKYGVNLLPSGMSRMRTRWDEYLYDVLSLMRERRGRR